VCWEIGVNWGTVLGQDLGGYCRFDLEYYWGIFGAVLMSFGPGEK